VPVEGLSELPQGVGGVRVLVMDRFVTGDPSTGLCDGMVSPEVIQAGLRLRVTEDQTRE
jgi:hypothetical protein